ncbi:BTAD domain-containing putative transcriptional regulator [Nocardia jejuensis]|uniref:BTAD domain-containing putative transcriptional regulator n=1 Tax=Nocardia jejuensis TaxID=328049 RepID=UPI0008370618|nr:BTAD domain-containing putative transcriptional regulator [Nocardia jejuensis]
MTGAELRVLGPLRLSVSGRDAALGTPMQRAVLGRLVVARGQVVSTERLVEDLWAGQPPAKAAAVLQVHIHTLRRLFEPDRQRRAPSRFIVSESSGYALKIAENAVDAWHFEEQLRTYQELISNPETRPDPVRRRVLLETAMSEWHGPALEAFAGADWAAAEANRLTDLYLTAVELDAHTKLELGRSGEVVLGLRQLFEERPGREGLVRLLALAQYRLGQQLEALTTIRRSREFLASEFGVDPGPALRRLETAILTHATELTPPSPRQTDTRRGEAGPAPAVQHPPPAATLRDSDIPFATGYSAELSELQSIAEQVRGGRLRLAWVAGEAGIGKTTLAETALSALAGTGWTIASGSCPEIDGAPMAWAWSEILADLDAGTSAGAQPHTGDAFTLSRTIAERCRSAATSAPVVLLLEDAHRADNATLQVLRQVTNWLREAPVLVLVTTRRSEAGPGVHNTAAALAQLTAVWLELGGLDLAGTRQTALAAGLRPIDDELLAQLHERTGGNPLFVRELSKLAAAQGNLDQVPDSIRELIEDRIAQLPEGVAEVLGHISIWGEGIELGILGLCSGIAEDTLIDLVAAAESAGLVGTGRSGSISFEHSLIRDAVYLSVPALRRGRMHWGALELLESLADEYPVVARDPDVLARHAMLGASADTARIAIDYVCAAARLRMDRRMHSETVRLLRAAVELHEMAGHDAGHADRDDRIALLDNRCALVTALAYDNRHREARAARGRALELADRLADVALIDRALTCWRAPVIWPTREWRDTDHRMLQSLSHALARYGVTEAVTRPLFAAALSGSGSRRFGSGADPAYRMMSPYGPLIVAAGAGPAALSDSAWATVVSADSMALSANAADPEAAAAAAATEWPWDEENPVWPVDGSPEMLVRLLVTATFELGLSEYAIGQRMARWALELAREVNDPESVCAAINALTFLESDFGPEFRSLTAELEQAAMKQSLAEYGALAHYLGYRTALAQADLREAGRRAAFAVECADEGQLQPLLDLVSCFAATMELLRGDVDLAERLYARFGERIARAGTSNVEEAQLFCEVAIGWARDDLSALANRLADAAVTLPSTMSQAYALALLHAGEHERARAVFDRTDPTDGPYPVLMSAMRARTAIALGDDAAIGSLYEFLAPHSGTVIGVETGMAEFGPVDAVLGALAEANGDFDAAAVHRDRARQLLERIRSELPETGSALLRAA